MRNLTLRALVGTPAILVAALKTGRFKATAILGIKKSAILGEGNFELITIDGEMPLKEKLELTIDEVIGTNHVITLKDETDVVAGHFLIEDTRLDIPDANVIGTILVEGAYDNDDNVRGAKDGTILMPANVVSDRARIRLVDGTYIEINLANQLGSGNAKLTASLIPGRDGIPAKLLIGAEGDEVVYTKPVDQLIIEAKAGKVDNIGEEITLDSPLKRLTRAKNGEVTIQTEGGNYKAKLDKDGEVEVIKAEAKQMDADDDTLGTWDNVGDSEAFTDAAGNPVQVFAQPKGDGGMKLAFLPIKGAPAKEVQA